MKIHDVLPVADFELQLGLLISMLDDVTQDWREELGEISIEDLTWQPFPHGHSIGGILLHIIEVEHYWIHHVASGIELSTAEALTLKAEEIDQYAVSWPTPDDQPLSWYFELQDGYRKKTKELLFDLKDPEKIAQRGESQFTLRWIVQHVVAHEAYHAGQMVLLSLMRSRVA